MFNDYFCRPILNDGFFLAFFVQLIFYFTLDICELCRVAQNKTGHVQRKSSYILAYCKFELIKILILIKVDCQVAKADYGKG